MNNIDLLNEIRNNNKEVVIDVHLLYKLVNNIDLTQEEQNNIIFRNNSFYLPEIVEEFDYFDVQYISPSGALGTHTAVTANNIQDAARRSPIMLCYGTNYHPDQFKVVSVKLTEEHNKPK